LSATSATFLLPPEKYRDVHAEHDHVYDRGAESISFVARDFERPDPVSCAENERLLSKLRYDFAERQPLCGMTP